MLGKDLSEALSGIADDKIEAAANMTPVRHHRPTWVRFVACAAVLAILISAVLFWPGETMTEDGQIIAVPGVLKVYAAAQELTDQSDVVYVAPIGGVIGSEKAIWAPFTSVAGFGIPLTFSVPESLWGNVVITFDITAEHGYFLDKKTNPQNLGSNETLNNGDKVYWRGESILDIADTVGENGVFYIDVIIRADGRIVGCGVISLVYQKYACMAYSLATVGYPLVDGDFQDISEAVVLEHIANLK
jgi:hypothetical protein